MNKITTYLSNGEKKVYLKNGFVRKNENSRMLLKNIAIYWNFQNIHQDNREVKMVSALGVETIIQFGTGYWTFNMIAQQLAEEGISLEKNRHNNTCRIHCSTHTIELGEFGTILGFAKNTIVQRDVWKDSGTVNINMGLEFITIGSYSVKTLRNFDTNGERSNIIATFLITTEQSLNETVTFYKDVNFEAPITNGTHNSFNFHVGTNVGNDVKLNILIECYMK